MCVSEVYSVFRRCRSPGNIKSDLHNIFRTLKQIKTLERHVPRNAKNVKLNIKKSEVIKNCFFMTFLLSQGFLIHN